MHQLKKLFEFLTSLWGALAVLAIAFPGASSLLNIPISVSNSRISDLYPVIGTISSAFCLLILLSYQEELKVHAFARRLAVWAGLVGFACFMGFVVVKVFFLDIEASRQSVNPPERGELFIEHRNSGVIMSEHFINGELVATVKRGDPMDVVALALFAATFASFTLAFSALGIHTFKASEV